MMKYTNLSGTNHEIHLKKKINKHHLLHLPPPSSPPSTTTSTIFFTFHHPTTTILDHRRVLQQPRPSPFYHRYNYHCTPQPPPKSACSNHHPVFAVLCEPAPPIAHLLLTITVNHHHLPQPPPKKPLWPSLLLPNTTAGT